MKFSSFFLLFTSITIYRIIASTNSMISLKLFQKASNGFDIRGIYPSSKIIDSSELDGPLLSKEAAFWFGYGFARWLENCEGYDGRKLSVAIGRDPRESGLILSSWFAGGVEQAGAIPCNVGLCTTPAMYLSCCSESSQYAPGPWPFDGAVCITASHLPPQWNGIKFFDSNSPTNIGEEAISNLIALSEIERNKDHITPHQAQVNSEDIRFLPVYTAFLQDTAKKLCMRNMRPYNDLPLKDLKICVNAGNGAGGFLASALSELGADTTPSFHLEPDGTFPNHIPNPEDKVAISMTAQRVLDTGSDIGICLDTDADRVGIVDSDGRLLNRNGLIALVSKIALRESPPGGIIVTDSATSNGLRKFIEDTLGGKHISYKKGYRNVIELARSTPGCVAAVECSGHGAWRDNGWVDDGCYTAVRLVSELAAMKQTLGKTGGPLLSAVISELQEPAESHEFRLRVKADVANRSFEEVMKSALNSFRSIAMNTVGWSVDPVQHDGIRAQINTRKSSEDSPDNDTISGWCMLRASLHEPILSLHVESDNHGGAKIFANTILGYSNRNGLHSLANEVDIQSLVRFVTS